MGKVAIHLPCGGEGIPSGFIGLWSGAAEDIPEGWALCDGTNGTPDLRDRFVVGAGHTYQVGAAGGEAAHTLTIAEMPSHSHGIRIWDNNASTQVSNVLELAYNAYRYDASYSSGAGGSRPYNNLPPYYALAFIMKL